MPARSYILGVRLLTGNRQPLCLSAAHTSRRARAVIFLSCFGESMTTLTSAQPSTYFDFRKAIAGNRLLGLWQAMSGYRLPYLGAVTALMISALAKTASLFLLRYFADLVSGPRSPSAAV